VWLPRHNERGLRPSIVSEGHGVGKRHGPEARETGRRSGPALHWMGGEPMRIAFPIDDVPCEIPSRRASRAVHNCAAATKTMKLQSALDPRTHGSFKLLRSWERQVGPHLVRIEKRRPLLFAGFRTERLPGLCRRPADCGDTRHLAGIQPRSASCGMPIGATRTRPATADPRLASSPVLGRWNVTVT